MGGHRELVKDKTVLVPDSDPQTASKGEVYSDCQIQVISCPDKNK